MSVALAIVDSGGQVHFATSLRVVWRNPAMEPARDALRSYGRGGTSAERDLEFYCLEADGIIEPPSSFGKGQLKSAADALGYDATSSNSDDDCELFHHERPGVMAAVSRQRRIVGQLKKLPADAVGILFAKQFWRAHMWRGLQSRFGDMAPVVAWQYALKAARRVDGVVTRIPRGKDEERTLEARQAYAEAFALWMQVRGREVGS